MNRIVVIGNGFDKAHGLATGYKDFIDAYWNEFAGHIFGGYSRWQTATYGELGRLTQYKDDFVKFEIVGTKYGRLEPPLIQLGKYQHRIKEFWNYNDVQIFVSQVNIDTNKPYVRLTFKNDFFKHISNRCYLINWVDIENEYYGKLRALLTESDVELRNQYIQKLNQDFEAVKKLLAKYLMKTTENTNPSPKHSIEKAFNCPIELEEIAHSKRGLFFKSIVHAMTITGDDMDMINDIDNTKYDDYLFLSKEESIQYYIKKKLETEKFKENYCQPSETLLLNFNYTNIAEHLYGENCKDVIHIHGELGNPHNPIIFGYGDELDEEYKRIERLQDNDFLENIKSIRYHETGNYQKLLSFLEADLYQVVIMGHSCGNSDRTLLNTLLEHPNCASVKVYYRQIDENTDNYSQIVRNLSRNFNDKAAMRDKVVNKGLCSPLVPMNQQPA